MNLYKTVFHWMLGSAFVCGFSCVAVSCSDDDDNLSAEEQSQQATEASSKFWSVVGKLTDGSNFADDWQNATFVPTIGEPDGANEAVRIVITGDLATAVSRFADLTGATDVNENTPTYTWTDPQVGTLTYTRTGGASLATADVNIRQMPGLSQIIYKSPDQVGVNGTFTGTAYYRFGDVVKKTADGHTDYWVCVRPAFGPEGKEDSHWVTLSPLYGKYIKEATVKSTKAKCYIPQGLNASKEHMQNLAELCYAMYKPEFYAMNLAKDKAYKTLGYFHDFNYEKNYNLNADGFFAEVKEYWANSAEGDLGRKIFGYSLDRAMSTVDTHGLCFVYDASMSKDVLTLKRYTFHGTNLKTYTKDETEINCANSPFNLSEKYTRADGHALELPSPVSERNTDCYIVRQATGKELCKGSGEKANYDKRQRLTNCEDVYVYNRVKGLDMNNLKNIAPEVSPYVSRDPYYRPGDVFTTPDGSRWFCFWPAGTKNSGKSSYAYFATFDGITTSSDLTRATNVPNRELAIRATYALQVACHQLNKLYVRQAVNIRMNCGVNLETLFPVIWTGDVRTQAVLGCVAYDPGIGSENLEGQPLLRVILDQQWHTYNNNIINVWAHYPVNPNETAYIQTDFTNVPILLSDLYSQDMVDKYAKDAYAIAPISSLFGGDNATPRSIRTQAEPGRFSIKVTDYFYEVVKWTAGEYKKSMWNEPVLFLRVAKVYDRGMLDHSTKTTDGQELTLKSRTDWWNADVEEDMWYDDNSSIHGTYDALGELFRDNELFIDEKPTKYNVASEDWN